MKIKIGNFNFINNNENKLSSYTNFDRDFFEYYYLDGKEDTLFVNTSYKFEKGIYDREIPKFESELIEKYKIVKIYEETKKQINNYITNKVEIIFKNKNYSKYKLYKDMDFRKINELKENKNFNYKYGDKLELDFERNKINIGKIQFNPYTEKIDNLEELFEIGFFKEHIKANLILKEIEKGIAPPYISEITKINEFLEGKKSVNLIFKDCEKFKAEARIINFLKLQDSKIELDLGYCTIDNFKKENPGKEEKDLKIEDLKGISYSKNVLDINGRVLANADKQIAITLDDRLKQKIDIMKEDIKDEYYEYRNKVESKGNNYIPYSFSEVINRLKEYKDSKEKPEWYSKELENIIRKNNLINFLEQAKTIDDIKDVCVELGDNELQNIYYGMLYEEENYEEEEEETV